MQKYQKYCIVALSLELADLALQAAPALMTRDAYWLTALGFKLLEWLVLSVLIYLAAFRRWTVAGLLAAGIVIYKTAIVLLDAPRLAANGAYSALGFMSLALAFWALAAYQFGKRRLQEENRKTKPS